MNSTDSMEVSISTIKQQRILMQRNLSQRKLMESLKNCSIMLQKLRNDSIFPKQYYELYILVYDSLTVLSGYLVENHPKRHHLADLYELVQYAGNILPRLYLMITVGSSFLQIKDSPSEEILKDMLEMCRGIQNPIRGLFLRYYLSQRTKTWIVESNLSKKFVVTFIITNFIEMNKLWVRLQHQGPLKERELRTKERKELQILIGSNLVRISQVIEDDIVIYQKEILPLVLEQVIQCRDSVSQEYLLDVICQVFPADFHLHTLDFLLDVFLKVNPMMSIYKVLTFLIERLNGFINRQDEIDTINERLKALKIGEVNVFVTFWKFLQKLGDERPDLSLNEFISMVGSILELSIKWYPDNLSNIDVLFRFLKDKCEANGSSIPQECDSLIKHILLFSNLNEHTLLLMQFITKYNSYRELLSMQSVSLQKSIINDILDLILQSDFKITNGSDLEMILLVCEPLIKINNTISEKSTPLIIEEAVESFELESDLKLNSEQEKLAKLVHICYHRSITKHVELLLTCKNWFYKGGRHMRFTYPSIISNFWKLMRKTKLKMNKYPNRKLKYENLLKQLFKYVSRCNNDLFNIIGSSSSDLIFKLNLQTAAIADQFQLCEMSYDFFTQSFAIFEESITDSHTQFQAIIDMAQILQKTRHLYDNSYYENLITRCTLYGSKLLKKQDQCRAVYLCSHLWWVTEIPTLGEEEGITENFYREGKRVLECLQRSLRIADSIIDNIQSCQLMVEILNRCCYYFIHGDENSTHVGVKYINGLIELIQTNLTSLKMEELGGVNNNDGVIDKCLIGTEGSYIHLLPGSFKSIVTTKLPPITITSLILIPTEFFQRTLRYMDDQKEVDDRFKAIIM